MRSFSVLGGGLARGRKAAPAGLRRLPLGRCIRRACAGLQCSARLCLVQLVPLPCTRGTASGGFDRAGQQRATVVPCAASPSASVLALDAAWAVLVVQAAVARASAGRGRREARAVCPPRPAPTAHGPCRLPQCGRSRWPPAPATHAYRGQWPAPFWASVALGLWLRWRAVAGQHHTSGIPLFEVQARLRCWAGLARRWPLEKSLAVRC